MRTCDKEKIEEWRLEEGVGGQFNANEQIQLSSDEHNIDNVFRNHVS